MFLGFLLLIRIMGKKELPDGGEYRVESVEDNKVRIYYDERVDGFRLRQTVVGVPAELSQLTEEGVTKLVNSMVHEDHMVACPFCEEVTPMGQMRGHSYAGSVCQACWDNCVCRQCDPDDWQHKSRSAKYSDEKKCPHCGQKFITSVGTA